MTKETLSTSTKEVPKHRNALSEKYEEAKKIGQEAEPLNPENIEKQKEQLPEPAGWRLLVLPFTPKEKTKGGRVKLSKGSESPYIGRYIKGDLGGKKVSNPSYVKYYKGLV